MVHWHPVLVYLGRYIVYHTQQSIFQAFLTLIDYQNTDALCLICPNQLAMVYDCVLLWLLMI